MRAAGRGRAGARVQVAGMVGGLASIVSLAGLPLNPTVLTVLVGGGCAVLLVLGVGFDNSLILSLSRSSQVAWRGATVSVLTSMLAFGLLAACATPVLKSFGVVAALGLLLVWLLVPIMAITSDSPLRN